jgi:phage terminase large subunit-like protein
MNPIDLYAESVVSGAVPAGKYHRLACVRHLKDRARENTPAFPYRFDLEKANRFFRFAEKLKHYKGKWAGQFIALQPWQKFMTGSLIGWVHTDTGLRRFRTAFNQVPRKNGKSLIAAIVLLYLTFFDGEAGAEGYAVATKRDQAKLVFNDAKKLVQSSGLKDRIKVLVANLHRDDTSSKLEPLGADHDSTDGLNPSCVTIDEAHAMKDRGMIDVMETATGAREQPVINWITTFGENPISPWGDQNDYACKVLEGVFVDETFFTFTTHADVDDDWQLESTAIKANPNYGISVNPEDLAAKRQKARGIPSAAATYKQKHLNLQIHGLNPCLSVDGWRKGQTTKTTWTLEDMAHEPCYVGVDLASKIDLCAVSFVFPPTVGRANWRLYQRIWTPGDTLADRAHRDRVPYQVWADQGWLTVVPGKTIDKSVVREAILEAREIVDIVNIGFDPWHDETPIQQLVAQDGFPEEMVLEVPQTFAGMSGGCLRIQADILSGDVDARGCPVTAWAVSCAVGSVDGKGNLMFTKDPKKMRGRIDPLIAASIAVSMFVRQPPVPDSVYLTRGVITLGQA